MKTSKNLRYIGLSVLVTILFASCQYQSKKSQIEELSAQNEELNVQLNERDSLMNEMIATFGQIEEALSYIRSQNQLLSNTSEAQELPDNQREQVVKDVQLMAEILKESRVKLNKLNKKLRQSGAKIASLESRIVELDSQLVQSQENILALTNELEAKNFEVGQLQEQVIEMAVIQEEQLATIEGQKGEIDNLNLAYYVTGTSKELKEKGLISKKGGFLGIGKTKSINENVQKEYFSEYDVRFTDSIPVSASAAILVTKHPAGSYEFITQDDKVSYLDIKEPKEFYKFSKYVVMEIK